ncbi:hypothetical protein niasHS_008009 [Heterodera schachtii]|uniref:Uncharacterized protein n=1 Tax=Heterodera schachtii TaxID=97005 RepID=A0ABD2JCQ9_HETSC
MEWGADAEQLLANSKSNAEAFVTANCDWIEWVILRKFCRDDSEAIFEEKDEEDEEGDQEEEEHEDMESIYTFFQQAWIFLEAHYVGPRGHLLRFENYVEESHGQDYEEKKEQDDDEEEEEEHDEEEEKQDDEEEGKFGRPAKGALDKGKRKGWRNRKSKNHMKERGMKISGRKGEEKKKAKGIKRMMNTGRKVKTKNTVSPF